MRHRLIPLALAPLALPGIARTEMPQVTLEPAGGPEKAAAGTGSAG